MPVSQPFSRTWWRWTATATGVLLLAIGLFVVLRGLEAGGHYTVPFTHFVGTPDAPVYNLTDDQAARLPGDLPHVLAKARQTGSAVAVLASPQDVSDLQLGLGKRVFISYQGALFKMAPAMATD